MSLRLRSIEELWQEQADLEAQKNRQLRYQHGHGSCIIFILDTSSSLGEDGFKEMKDTFISIIDEYAKYPDMDENVAVIVCGRYVKFQRYYSNRYEDIKHCLDDVAFGGPSPLTAAFYLSIGALSNGAGHTHVMGEFTVRPRFILISDGRPTSITDEFPTSDDSPQMETEEDRLHLLHFTRRLGKLHPFFCIPVGRRPDLGTLELMCNQSGGKIVRPHEARQFAKYSRNVRVAAILFSKLRNEHTDKERILMTLAAGFSHWEFTEKDQDDIYEIYSRKSFYRSMDDGISPQNLCTFEERDPRMPTLGTRVRRGPDWKWKNQDNYGPGTVVGHSNEDGWLFVEWDTGKDNAYRYGPVWNKYDVQCCNEPRILFNELIATGCLVTRGPDWEWGDQDGGVGKIGSVIKVEGSGILLVRWQHGFISQYRFGCNGKFDLEICDPFSPEAIKYAEGKMQNAEISSRADAQPVLEDDLENTHSSEKYKELEVKTENCSQPRQILRVTKGKYFKNKEVDMSSSDIETDGLTFSYAIKQWFWRDVEGKWNPYTKETNARINKCYKRDPKSTIIVTIQNVSYRLVMAKNIQINLTTREMSEIKLVEDVSNS